MVSREKERGRRGGWCEGLKGWLDVAYVLISFTTRIVVGIDKVMRMNEFMNGLTKARTVTSRPATAVKRPNTRLEEETNIWCILYVSNIMMVSKHVILWVAWGVGFSTHA